MLPKINTDQLPQLTISGTHVPYSDNIKTLGIHLNANLDSSKHIDATSKRVYFSLFSLYFKNSLICCIRTLLVKSLILSLFDYVVVLLTSLTKIRASKPHMLNNACAQFTHGSLAERASHLTRFHSVGCPLSLAENTSPPLHRVRLSEMGH